MPETIRLFIISSPWHWVLIGIPAGVVMGILNYRDWELDPAIDGVMGFVVGTIIWPLTYLVLGILGTFWLSVILISEPKKLRY